MDRDDLEKSETDNCTNSVLFFQRENGTRQTKETGRVVFYAAAGECATNVWKNLPRCVTAQQHTLSVLVLLSLLL